MSATADEAAVALLPDFVWSAPPPVTETLATAKAEKKVQAVAWLQPDQMPALERLTIGAAVEIPLGGARLKGRVRQVIPNDEGRTFVAGSLLGQNAGSFAFSRDLKTGERAGHVIDRVGKAGYEMKTTEAGVQLRKKPIDAVMCLMPRYKPPGPPPAAAAATRVTPAAITVPVLNSRSGAAGVLLLDFDGATVIDPDWNYGVTIVAAPATIGTTPITSAQITDVWRRVAEDYRSLDLNVTTDQAVYDATGSGHRARCIITPTDSWYDGYAGGVAYLESYRGPYASGYDFSSTVPCWCWNNNNTAIMAMTISHELGHMLNLSHDGTSTDEYYAGHDYGAIGWGPLMGAPFDKVLTQWSKGEYTDASNTEDDYAVMKGIVSEFLTVSGGVPDDFGGTAATAQALAITLPINQAGKITSSTDADYFSFKSQGGNFSVTATPDSPEGNLDPLVEVYDSMGGLLASSLQTSTTLVSTVTGSLPSAGTYYIAVKPRGRAADTAAGVIGYPVYGSQGAYTLSGTFVPLPEVPLIATQPASVVANQGTKVSLVPLILSNSPILYQWYKIVNGVDVKLTGKTTSTLAFTSIQPTDAGDYKLVATNKTGSSTTDVANIDVHYKPIIKVQPLPAKQTVATNATVVLSVTADGTAPVSYTWKKNGVVLPGETASSLTLPMVDWFDAGSYTVTVSNALGYVTSAASASTVSSAPLFTQQPSPVVKAIALSGTGSLTVKTVGTATITYQWFKDGLPIPKATKSSYAWSATTLNAEGTYFVRATNGVGFTDSDSFTVDVQDRPNITVPSTNSSLTLAADQPFSLDCTANGTETLNYQWQLNGVNVTDNAPNVQGTHSPNLRIAAVSWLHRGVWRCVVTNAVGSAISKTCTLSVNSYPLILTQPLDIKIAKNGTGTLKVVAGGSSTLKYQWYKDSVLIPKATSSSLVLSKASALTTPGGYYVVVSNTQPLPVTGPITSRTANVVVEDPPVAAPPSPLTQTVGIGDTVVITGSATGSPTLLYQWQKNNVNIPGETGATLTLTNVQTTATAYYRLVVTNDVGKAYSVAARVTVLTRPTISQQPTDQTVFAWDSPVFTAKAAGSPTLTYQWYFNGNPIPSKTNSTAVTSSLKLPSVQQTQAGTYTLMVSNAVGSVFSDDAILTVSPVPAPTLIDVRPTNVVVGDYIMVTGTNLNWTTKVTIGGKTASFVKIRSSNLRVKVPSGIPLTGSFTVDTYGGTVSWPSLITRDTDGAENDLFENARILTGTYYVAGGSDNTRATTDYYEPYAYYYRSVWFRFQAGFTGTARYSALGTGFHHVVNVFSGSPTATSSSSLRFLGGWQNHFGQNYNDRAYLDLPVTKDTEYFIQLQSAHAAGTSYTGDYGWCAVQMNRQSASPKAIARASFDAADGFAADAALDGQQGWQADGAAAGVTPTSAESPNGTGFIGGPGATASVVAASVPVADEGNSVLHARAEMKITSQPGVDEQFSWGLYAADGTALLATVFDAASHAVSVRPNGASVATSQVYVPGTDSTIEFTIDRATGAWTVSLNDIAIAQGEGLALPAGGVSHFAAGWRPSLTQSNRGIMNFDNVSLVVEDTKANAEPATEAPSTDAQEPAK